MPISSLKAKCKTCGKLYRIRYGLGDNFPQSASFPCDQCYNRIEVSLKEYGAIFEIENAIYVPEEEAEDHDLYEVRNVHAELPIPKEMEKNPIYFATTFNVHKLFGNSFGGISEMRKIQRGQIEFTNEWKAFGTYFELFSNNLAQNAESLAKKETKGIAIDASLWMEKFLHGPWEQIYQKMELSLTRAMASPNFTDYKQYLHADFPNVFHEIRNGISVYMESRTHFDKTIFFQKRNQPIDSATKIGASWDEIKSVYGDLYEIVGNLLYIVSSINNINAGRKFSEFSTPGFTIDKYKGTDKANRGENFKSSPEWAFVEKAYLPWLRNGTHHQKSRFYSSSELLEFKTGKGGSNVKKLQLFQYVATTNELFALLLMISKLYIYSVYKDVQRNNPV